MMESADLAFVDVTLTPFAWRPGNSQSCDGKLGRLRILPTGGREAESQTRSNAASHQNSIGPWLSGVARRTRQSRADLRTRSATRACTHILAKTFGVQSATS